MKKLVSILLVLVLALCLVSCGETDVEPTPAGDDTPVDEGPKAPSVCVVVGNASDKSFSESLARGAALCGSELGSEYKVIEFGSDETKMLPTLEDLSEDGKWDIIAVASYSYVEYIEACAEKYPDQNYVLFDAASTAGYPNVYSADYKGNEGAYLAGALAAMVTTDTEEMEYANPEKVVGWVGGMDMTLINDFVLGFIQGAHDIDPEVKVITSYTNSFSDTAKGKELAQIMIDSGCDLVYNGAGGAGMGCLEAGKENHTYSIGTDSDQAMLFADDPEKANLILASQLKSLDVNLLDVATRYMNGEDVFGHHENLGVASGVIRLSDNEFTRKNVPAWMLEKLEELSQGIKDGTIVVESAYGQDDAVVHEKIDAARP